MARHVIVVERYNAELLARLTRQFHGDDGVAILVDRRKGRRRRRSQMREMDRRQLDRRCRPERADDLRSQEFFWISCEAGQGSAVRLSGTA
jgi:hypothetical protein